jgi:hypothetical protein
VTGVVCPFFGAQFPTGETIAKRPNAVGRPPTSGTRHGNGRGWGGPAKGASVAPEPITYGPQFTTDHQPPPPHVTTRRRRRRAQRLDALADTLHQVILGQRND